MTGQLLATTGIPLLLALTTASVRAVEIVPTNPKASEAGPQTVKGEVVKIDGRFYVVKDPQGKELRFLVGKDTEMAGNFKEGDTIEVQAASVEHAMAIMAGASQIKPQDDASQKITGTLVKIEGHFYTVKDEQGREVRLHVSADTKLPEGLKPGAAVEALVTPVEHAMFIKAGKSAVREAH